MIEFDNDEIFWWRPFDGGAGPDTRGKILFAAYKEIHVNGFQAASLNNVLAHTGLTKGALYHHFPNKTALGYAVLEEVIARRIIHGFIEPLARGKSPIDDLIGLIHLVGNSFTLADIQLGCPLSGLAQEMAPIDEGFRQRIVRIYRQWHDAIGNAVTQAQKTGIVIEEVDPEQLALKVVAAMEGCMNVGMIFQDISRLQKCCGGLANYLSLIKIDSGKAKSMG